MGQTNAQAVADYNSLPWYERAMQAAGDIANRTVNGATGGLFNRGIAALAGSPAQDVTDYENARNARAGVAGDVANVAGMVRGGGVALDAGKAALGMARAAPTALSLLPTAGAGTAARFLTGTAGPGLVPAVEAIAPKALLSTAAKAAGIAGLIGVSAAGRQTDTDTAPKTDAGKAIGGAVGKAMAQGAATPAAAAYITPQARSLAALDTILKSPNMTLSDLQTATGLLPRPLKPLTPHDQVIGKAAALSDQLFQSDIANATKLGETDEKGGQAAVAKALADNYRRVSAMAQVNPLNMAEAQMFQQPQE